jgi:hypothetical protein
MSLVMKGFPPKDPDQVTLSNWRTAPFNKWGFQHVREIIPSANIANNPKDVWSLTKGKDNLSSIDIETVMESTNSDAVVVLQSGKLIKEIYRNGMDGNSQHILMSVSKSILGLIAGKLIEIGKIKADDQITSFIPELADSAYAGSTIRNLLDMRSGISFNEDYLKKDGPIIDYRFASNWNPVPADWKPQNLRSFMSTLTETLQNHGGNFQYVSPNTDLLGWVFERATGIRYSDLVSELLWKPLGAETPGYITVDRIGGARAAGGKCFSARDLARVGMMLADGGKREGHQVISEQWVNDIENNGDQEAWAQGNFYEVFNKRDMKYRSKWYVQQTDVPLIHAWGIHGQFIFVDRSKELSISWFSSQTLPVDQIAMEKTFSVVEKIRAALS